MAAGKRGLARTDSDEKEQGLEVHRGGALRTEDEKLRIACLGADYVPC